MRQPPASVIVRGCPVQWRGRGQPVLLSSVLLLGVCLARAGEAPSPPIDWNRFSVLTPAGPEEPSPEAFRKLNRLIYSQHRVNKGEYSAWHLAKLYNTTSMSLQTTNNNEMMILYPGMKVSVHNKTGMLYEVKKDGTLLEDIRSAHQKYQKLKPDDFLKAIVEANRLPGSALLADHEFARGDKLLLPGLVMAWDTYHFPFMTSGAPRISSRFGSRYHPLLKRVRMHDGLDMAKPYGTPVVPARNGQVVEAGWHEGYGLMVVLRHSDGFTTRYGHLSKIFVRVGQAVKRGATLIGNVGSTGISTGPHLHFEVRDKNGHAVNPNAKIGRR